MFSFQMVLSSFSFDIRQKLIKTAFEYLICFKIGFDSNCFELKSHIVIFFDNLNILQHYMISLFMNAKLDEIQK